MSDNNQQQQPVTLQDVTIERLGRRLAQMEVQIATKEAQVEFLLAQLQQYQQPAADGAPLPDPVMEAVDVDEPEDAVSD